MVARNILQSLAVLLAFVSVGALTGAIGYGYAEAVAQLKSVREILTSDTPDLKGRLSAALGQSNTAQLHLPASGRSPSWRSAWLAFSD
jgi:hypothetical protein